MTVTNWIWSNTIEFLPGQLKRHSIYLSGNSCFPLSVAHSLFYFERKGGFFFFDILVFDYTNIPRNNSVPFSLLMPSSPPHCEKRCSSFEKKKISPTLEHKSPQPLRLDNESSETYLLGHLHLTSIKTVIQGLDRPASSTHHLQQNPYQRFHN
jgi:hypothetical protein